MGTEVARTTDLLASNGTNVVLAAVVVLFLIGVLGVYVVSMRSRLSDERAERAQERAERKAMFAKLLGNGNDEPGALDKLGTEVAAVQSALTELGASNTQEHAQITVRLDDGAVRFAQIDQRCVAHRGEAASMIGEASIP